MNKNEKLHVFFSYSEGIGPKTFLKLLNHFKSAEKIYNASEKELSEVIGKKNLEKFINFKNKFDPQKIIDEIESKDIWVLPYSDYPKAFQNISNPPICLYGRGDKSLIFDENKIGIVGSRRPTSYGVSVTESFTKELVDSGLVIVSGMALGIDSIAHKSCLKAKGRTIAVLGSGVDVPTPSEHYGLYQQIIKNGGAVVSEFPLGMVPNKGSFPSRNRIISALSKVILIPEATSDSGALITAREAFDQKRKVFVIPGAITSNLSKGTNNLLSKGGIAVGSAEDILDELRINNYELTKNKKNLKHKTNIKDPIAKLLIEDRKTTNELVKLSKKSTQEINSHLSLLELDGVVEQINGEWVLKN